MKFVEIIEALKRESMNYQSHVMNDNSYHIRNLLTDSRNLFQPSETLFFAIHSKHGNDGHRYLDDLYNRGIRNFIVEYIPDDFSNKKDINLIKVSNTVEALSTIGKMHRINTEKLVAITGSKGKTTLKETIFRLLETVKRISRSPRSYNSKIGVPLSLWQIPPKTEMTIIEAGISRQGEMKPLTNLIEPDIVIITNLDDTHSEGFPDKESKAEEKLLLADNKNVRKIIYPKDDLIIADIVEKKYAEKELISWSMNDPAADVFVTAISSWPDKRKEINYKWKDKDYTILVQAEKDYEIENAVSALAFMLSEGISREIIEERFSKLQTIGTRLNVSNGINGCSVILDSYTSDFSSLPPVIDFMRRRRMPSQSMTLILSDICHETENLEEAFKNISNLIKEGGISRFIGIGGNIKKYSSIFPADAVFFDDTQDFLRNFSAADFVDELILLKGAPEFNFGEIFRILEARKHETVLEVNLDAIVRNYNYFRSLVSSETGIIVMVKAFGYGVGSYEIAKTLQDCGASYLAVAVLDEGVDLRKNGIVMPVMIMNPRSANYNALFSNRLEPVVYSMSMLKEILTEAKKNSVTDYPIHIKLDTGMHRMGFMEGELKELIEVLSSTSLLRVKSVFSHLATADCVDMDEFTIRQLVLFDKMSSYIKEGLGYEVKRHILNSAGIIRFHEYQYDLVRLGIGLYGANTLPANIEKPLSTVATLRTIIVCIREIEKGEAVGYSRKGMADRKMRIATLPIGYADGMNRRFGNGRIKVLVNGQEASTIGNICMDATMIDVTDIECVEGDSVEIFGETMPLQRLADSIDTIPYEILTSVSPRVKRIYYRE